MYYGERNGITHVLEEFIGRSERFGYASLCDSLRLPREEDHFEFDPVRRDTVTCSRCEETGAIAEAISDPNDDSGETAAWDGHLVRVERDDLGRVDIASLYCGTSLEYYLDFEPPSFKGDLRDQASEVCLECWEAYESRQWKNCPERSEFEITTWEDGEQKRLYAFRAEALGEYSDRGTIRLTSRNWLTKEIAIRDVERIRFLESENIDY